MANDAFQLTAEQALAVSLLNVQANQMLAAAHELKQPHINQPEAAAVLERTVAHLNARREDWLRETQRVVKLASPAIADKLLVTH
jgi:hypothetical protein